MSPRCAGTTPADRVSPVLKAWRLLGKEAAYALGAILCAKRAVAERERRLDRLALGPIECHGNRLLAQLQGHVWHRAELARDLERDSNRAPARYDAIDEPPGERRLDCDRVAQEHHFLRPRRPNPTGHPNGAAAAREYAKLDLRQRDHRTGLGDDEVAAGGKLESATERQPVEGSDRRLREFGDPSVDLVLERELLPHHRVRNLREFLDVGPGTERALSAAGQHHG